MFEDITKEKKDLLKSALGLDLTTKLNANVIAEQIVEKQKYNTEVILEFKIKKLKNGTMTVTMNNRGQKSEYVLNEKDTLKFTHYFDVVL